ncbi:MAG: protein kinase [Pirellulaceae bacterium]|nr:protein kinase [Pirellulaceae bacterium]
MGTCPKCKSSIEQDAKGCPACGAVLPIASDIAASEKPGTLNVSDLFPMNDSVSEKASTDKNAPDLEATLDSLPESDLPPVSEPSDGTGTMHLLDSDSPSSAAPGESSGTSETLEDPESLRKLAEISDESSTVVLPQSSDPDQTKQTSRTVGYSETELRDARTGRVSGGSTAISSGQLKKVWEAAIGSSGKDSKQSLRHSRAEASDSVFRRVATRVVADANALIENPDYQIKDKLGEGGMGIVYSAVQTTVNRIVALKSIRQDKRTSDKSRNQFFYEAEITADLDHPNIPPIYDLATTKDGLLFYSMKLIDGIEWQKLLTKKTREENLEIFKKVSDAVAFAHSKGVIHRDLKPDNVMLGKYGEVYVADWGLAYKLNSKRPCDFGGTPDYMAPEMARNRHSKIGKASDIYLLGAVLFQVLTGSAPHTGKKVLERLAAAERNEIAPANTDDTLLEIAYRAMATEPSDRYESVDAFQAAIQEIRQHEESITLTHRAEEAVGLAISSKDYDRFTRAIFGYRDAIELWGENQAAVRGLQRARFAYGQCAFDKGDNDLVLQTLDRNVESESKLYDKALKAKEAVLQREARFKTLRRTFVAALLIFLCSMSVVSIYAWSQRTTAIKEAASARQSERNAIKQEGIAVENAIKANTQKGIAEENAMEAIRQTGIAEENAMEAIRQKGIAVKNEMEAIRQKGIAVENEMEAKNQTEIAKNQTEIAKNAKEQAQKRAAQIQLGDYQSKLGLAKLQVERFDIQGASQLLGELKGIATEGFNNFVPKLDTWGWQRVNMLTNADLPRQELGGSVTAVEFAKGKGVGIAGTANGTLQLLRYVDGKLTIESSVDYPQSTIETVAISPQGDEVIFCVKSQGKNQVHVWPLNAGSKPQKLESTQNREFQTFSYSPDGNHLIGGINGGIWHWTRSSNWITQASPKEVPKIQNVRGRLASLQWIDQNNVLANSMLDGKPTLYSIDLQGGAQSSQLVELPAEIAQQVTAVQVLPGKRILFGMSDGSMVSGEWETNAVPTGESPTSPIGKLVELPRKHRTSIKHLIANAVGELLSMSDEPVAHVWNVDSSGAITYDSYLTGAPSAESATNLSLASFIDDKTIVGIDEAGAAIAWDVARQKQRRQLNRISSDGVEEYASPVVGVFSRGQSQQVLSVTQDGVVDLWSLLDGRTIKINEMRWSYFGHTPGADFVDSAIDMKAGLVVTSANLKNAERRYLENPEHSWEFCVWDQKTGNMVRRWTEMTEESVEPRLSILESGKQLLISSGKNTRIVDFAGNPVFQTEELGTYFAVPNPVDPSQTAMIKRSGYTWLWDRKNSAASMESRRHRFVPDDENEDGFPLKGAWSSNGERLYIVYSNGMIYNFEKDEYTPSQSWPRKKLWQAESGTTVRSRYHYDVDIAIADGGDQSETLYVNTRIGGNRPETRLTVIKYDPISKQSSVVESESRIEAGVFWLDDSNGKTPLLSEKLSNRFNLNVKSRDSVLSRVNVGQHTFVSTRSGKVYDLTDSSQQWVSLGRNQLISATADRDGKMVWTLHNDGSIWNLELSVENQGEWKRVAWSAEDAQKIVLAPAGDRLAILSKTNALRIVDVKTGNTLVEQADAATFVWDSADLIIGYRDGKLERMKPDGREALGSVEMEAGSSLISLNLFHEDWIDPNQPANRYLLVQTEDDQEGLLQFVALDGKNEKVSNPQSVSQGLRVATSPTDPVFVTGENSGTVSVWFASPKWDRVGKLFDLEGHRGAAIETVTFSNDGHTLVTSDKSNRLLGWLSQDNFMK